MIDIEQHALCALKQNAFAVLARDIEFAPDRPDEGRYLRRDFFQLRKQRAGVDFRRAETAAQGVVMNQQVFDLRP